MAWRMAEPFIKTPDGLLRGQVLQAIRGVSYYSFQGIPYAEPPVGPLRFKAPQRVKPWTGEREALKVVPGGPAFILGTQIYLETSSEDCLYLNVYMRELPEKNGKKKPVMFWIHGGGFYGGSGDTDLYGPDYIVEHDVILVTVNYRIGALGFLSLQNEVCPGNNGLKDQVEGLRWVRRNIASFGGDPFNVTIFGESAGGASVQYHLLSPTTRGLFQRAISQSGSALNPWAMARKPVQSAFKLGEILGFATDSKEKLLEFLMTVPPRIMVEKSTEILRQVEPDIYYLDHAFNPVVEPDLPHAFLSESPEILVKEGRFHDVPYIIGFNDLEGPAFAPGGLPPLSTYEEWKRLLPIHPRLNCGTPLADKILDKIKSFYFPNGYDQDKCAEVLSAIFFLAGIHEVLKGLSTSKNRRSKIFLYRFSFDGGLSVFKPALGYSDWKGTFHADDLTYLFYSYMIKPQIEQGSENDRLIDSFCKLWTDFATYGDPTPNSKLWPEFTWKERRYLDIGLELVPSDNRLTKEMDFWANIYAEIQGFPTPNS